MPFAPSDFHRFSSLLWLRPTSGEGKVLLRLSPPDLPCSLSKPVSGSCCLYNGVRIAGKQVTAILVPTSLPKSGFATRLVISSLHQQFTCVHLPDTHLP